MNTTCATSEVRRCAGRPRPRAGSGLSSRTQAGTRSRSGFTLVELMVVLAILGVMAGIAGLAAPSLERTDPAAERAAQIAGARRRALDTRRPVTLILGTGDSVLRMLALPDGSVRADSALGIDVLTGRPR